MDASGLSGPASPMFLRAGSFPGAWHTCPQGIPPVLSKRDHLVAKESWWAQGGHPAVITDNDD